MRSVKWLQQIKQKRKIASTGYKRSSEAQLCKSVLWASPYIYIGVSDYVPTEIHLYIEGDSPHRVQSWDFLFSVKGRRFVLDRGEGALKRSEDMAVIGHSALLQNVSKGDTDAWPNFVSQSLFNCNLLYVVEPGLLTGFYSLVDSG